MTVTCDLLTWYVNRFKAIVTKGTCQFTTVSSITFFLFLLVSSRYISRMNHYAVNTCCLQLTLSPEPTKTCFIHCMVIGSRVIAFKQRDQLVWFRWLCKFFQFKVFVTDAYGPLFGMCICSITSAI